MSLEVGEDMPEDYEAIKNRVEKYFDLKMHTFEAGRTANHTCRNCFLKESNPVHIAKDTNEQPDSS